MEIWDAQMHQPEMSLKQRAMPVTTSVFTVKADAVTEGGIWVGGTAAKLVFWNKRVKDKKFNGALPACTKPLNAGCYQHN